MLAVKRKDEDAIKWLITRGADPDKPNDTGLSARKIAETKGPKRLLRITPQRPMRLACFDRVAESPEPKKS